VTEFDSPAGATHSGDMRLQGRRSECEALGGLLEEARSGRSAVLVVRGEAGVGKTALLDHMAGSASDLRLVRAVGVESEMELPFAALHQLCMPLLDNLSRIPVPQCVALETAFGKRMGPVPDRFLIGLAVLSLLSETAGKRPLVCVVDDAQWLDQASAQALAFAARRLHADPVVMVFAAREPGADLSGLPQLLLNGLQDADARRLLDSVVRWPLDEQVRLRIVAEARGNPLALLELPRGHAPNRLAGGFGLPQLPPLPGRIEESFRQRIADLPGQTRLLVQLVAADPVGDPVLVWRAATQLGIPMQAAEPATEAGLLVFGATVSFRHPLVRSAAYRSASPQVRQAVHGALAESTDAGLDPDRRAWHRAQAASGPDEDVADELERCADRAQARGGVAAAAAFLERATALTPAPVARAQRALAAASAKVLAGAYEAAQQLLDLAQAGPLDEPRLAHADLLRAQLAYASNRGSDAPLLLLRAAKKLEGSDIDLARTTYLHALNAALFAGRLAVPGGSPRDVARAVRAAPRPSHPPRAADLLLDGLATHYTEGYAAGLPILRQALTSVRGLPELPEPRLLMSAWNAALHLWDADAWDTLSASSLAWASDAGALSELPLALNSRAVLLLFFGELTAAAALIDEAQAATEVTGGSLTAYAALALAALQGREDEARTLIDTTRKEVMRRGDGIGMTTSAWAEALLYNGIGNYHKALAAAESGSENQNDLGVYAWSTVELIEAAARSGSPERATDALRRLSETTSASGTAWALGVEARSRALLSPDELAEPLYREAIEQLGRTPMRLELARAHLLFGEWLRRENRRSGAREQLHIAYEMLSAMGAEGFADRARRELLATGATVRKRSVDVGNELTAQESQIARLARDGLTNPEISTQLFISARTVEWHLHKVFAKLGISSRRQLRASLAASSPVAPRE
jgi:DNA-binding CsgD family transcriptional regulator